MGSKTSHHTGMPLVRALLHTRVDDPALLATAFECEADALVFDITGPAPDMAAIDAVTAHHAKQPRILVRVGPLADERSEIALALALRMRPFALMTTGLAGRADLDHLATKLAVAEAEAGLPDGSTRVIAVADTARGVLGLATLAGSPRLAGLAWDHAALSVDLGADPHEASERPGDPRLLARALTVLAAKAAGVPAIDTAFPSLDDLVGLDEQCRAARRDGFSAKLAIHPGQVPTVNATFERNGGGQLRSD